MLERRQLAAKYATDFKRIAGEFDRIVTQCQKSKHLFIQSSRTVAKAGRLLFKAIDDGVLPHRFTGLVNLAKLNANPMSDANAMGFFGLFGTAFLKSVYPERFNSNAGAFALSPKPKTDENGKLLGRHGQPVTWVVTGEKGKPGYSARLSDEVATVADDYDELDGLEHLRARTVDYADTCRALAEVFRMKPEVDLTANQEFSGVPKEQSTLPNEEKRIAGRPASEFYRDCLREDRERIHESVEELRTSGDLIGVLRLLRSEIDLWLAGLRQETEALFADNESGRILRQEIGATPSSLDYIIRAFVIWIDACDLLEMAVGPMQAQALSRRIKELNKLRFSFKAMAAELASNWDGTAIHKPTKRDEIEDQRLRLSVVGVDACRFIDTLTSFVEARYPEVTTPLQPKPAQDSSDDPQNSASEPVVRMQIENGGKPGLPFHVCEDTFSITMHSRRLVFSGRGKKLFRLFVRISRRPGFRVHFDSLREVGDVWNGYSASDTTIRSAVHGIRTKLRGAGLIELANAIHTDTYGGKPYVILNREELLHDSN